MTVSLDRLLWRHEYGKLAPELLEIELRDALDRLGDAALDVLEHAETIRRWNGELLQSRTDVFGRAARAVDRRQFRDALRHIRISTSILATMRLLLQAVERAERADEAMHAVYELAAVPRLRHLPAITSLAQLVDAARLCINEQRYLGGSLLADASIRLAASLREQRFVEAAQRATMDDRLQAVEDLCVATRPFCAPAQDDDPSIDGTLPALRRLLDQGLLRLASRLLSELEVQLAGRRRFLLHYQRTDGGGIVFGAPQEVLAFVRDLSWDGAVDHYWHLSIAGHAQAAERQRARVEAAHAAFDAALQPTTDV